MKQLFALATALGLTLSACGDNTDKVTTEPPGSNCPNGGVAIESNGTTTYVCDGTDGSGGTSGQNGAAGSDAGSLTWTTITADTTARASYGYIADAASAITLTLPPTTSLSLGDDVRLIVHGAADVSIAPNGAQTFDYDRAQLGWRPLTTTPSVEWSQLVISGDGTSLVGMSGESSIYRSGDSGATWSQLTGMTSQNLQS